MLSNCARAETLFDWLQLEAHIMCCKGFEMHSQSAGLKSSKANLLKATARKMC